MQWKPKIWYVTKKLKPKSPTKISPISMAFSEVLTPVLIQGPSDFYVPVWFRPVLQGYYFKILGREIELQKLTDNLGLWPFCSQSHHFRKLWRFFEAAISFRRFLFMQKPDFFCKTAPLEPWLGTSRLEILQSKPSSGQNTATLPPSRKNGKWTPPRKVVGSRFCGTPIN